MSQMSARNRKIRGTSIVAVQCTNSADGCIWLHLFAVSTRNIANQAGFSAACGKERVEGWRSVVQMVFARLYTTIS